MTRALDDATRADLDALSGLGGMFVGMLSPAEVEAFDRLCEAGLAYRAYEGASGLMGLAQVRFNRASLTPSHSQPQA
jgi:hypothetical protein